MTVSSYDCIVLGTGGVGSAALYSLASRGARVLGLDRFAPPHASGSSHGQTRLIRKAYYEHPNYVPLLQQAYSLWRQLEQVYEAPLFDEIGLLEAGPSNGGLIAGVKHAAEVHGLELEECDPADVAARFPGFVVPEDWHVVFERQAGLLHVEECVRAHLEMALRRGAECQSDVVVHDWKAVDQAITLETSQGTYSAARLVVTAGAWSSSLLEQLGIPLRVLRKSLFWYACPDARYAQQQGAPCFTYELEDQSFFYGFPSRDSLGLKVAEHSGGATVDDPLQVDRQAWAAEEQRVLAFLKRHLPGVSQQRTEHVVCLYTMSPDGHFIVDRHPTYEQVCFAAGLSGHGFKFTSVLGEVLADLALEGTTQQPIGFLNAGRCRR